MAHFLFPARAGRTVAVRDALMRLLEPEVEAEGLELVELEWNPHGRGGLLRLYVDRPGADGGVTVDDCEAVSRRASAVLDATDPIPGEYTLEVSSPGFDRPLRTPAHFARFVGQRARIETGVPRDGRRRWTGTLAAAEGGRIVLEVDGAPVEFGLDEVRTARLVPDYGTTRGQRRE